MRTTTLLLSALLFLGCPEETPSTSTPDATVPDATADASADAAADVGPDVPVTPVDLITIPGPGEARAGIVTSADELLSGPKADGQIGDVKMFNSKLAVIIEGVRRASGFRFWGGNIADAVAVRPDGTVTEDTFGEIAHTWNLMVFEPKSIAVINDGRDGNEAHVRVEGVTAPFAWAADLLGSITLADELTAEVTYDYYLAADASAVRHEVRFVNIDTMPADVAVPVIVSSQGDGIHHWRRGSGFSDEAGDSTSITMSGRELAHGMYASNSALNFLIEATGAFVVTETSFVVPPGGFAVRTYHRVVSPEGIAGVERIGAELGLGQAVDARIEGTLTLPSTADVEKSWMSVWAAGDPITMAPIHADGTYAVNVSPGDYEVRFHVLDHGSPAPVDVTATAGNTVTADATVQASGTIATTVRTSNGDLVPARIMAVVDAGSTDTPSPHPPSVVDVRGDRQWGWGSSYGQVSAVGYAADGTTTVTVPPGTYQVRATRGFFYSWDSQTVTVGAGEEVTAELQIDSAVDRTGWVSADFHIHAARSPDSVVPRRIRVLQALTEEIDAPVVTEHIALNSLGPIISDLGLQGQVLNVPGQEVSTVIYGHFNAFPLEYRPTEANGGNVIEFGRTAAQLFVGVQEQSERFAPFLQVNHPRGSSPIQAYFTYLALDPVTAQPTKNAEGWDTTFDGIEVFNDNCDVEQQFQDWVNLTNMGMRKALSSGSDTHGENSPIGKPRQLVQVAFDAVEQDAQAIADAMKERRSIVTCGPMVTFETDDGVYGLGDMAPVAGDGSVSFRVQVQAPAWQELVEARLMKNGEVVDVLPITELAGGVRLDAVVTDTPAADAWYMVHVVGAGNLSPVHSGGPPAAFTNPIEVDADGDGSWTPPGIPTP